MAGTQPRSVRGRVFVDRHERSSRIEGRVELSSYPPCCTLGFTAPQCILLVRAPFDIDEDEELVSLAFAGWLSLSDTAVVAHTLIRLATRFCA